MCWSSSAGSLGPVGLEIPVIVDYAAAQLAEYDNAVAELAVTHYAMGNSTKADEYLAELIENTGDSFPFGIARVYGYRGEADKTFEWLDRMVENNDFFPTFILGDTALQSVHSDPRWPPFLEKLGLLEFWKAMPSTKGP